MDISTYFSPCPVYGSEEFYPNESKYFGKGIRTYTQEGEFPDLQRVKIALLGVEESSGSAMSYICNGQDKVRDNLYKLYGRNYGFEIADLGNLKNGDTLEDTYYALSEVYAYLLECGIIPLIIGGSQDLSYACYKAYHKLKKAVNILNVDSCFDIGDPDLAMDSESFMGKIIMQKPNYLFNYSNLGFQSYLVENEAVKLMSELYFDAHRYGALRGDIKEAEPIIRNADYVSIDMCALRMADSPANAKVCPTGFSAEEMCQIMRYAGLNGQLSGIGVYEYMPHLDKRGQSAQLIAEMIWCFIEGISERKEDHPDMADKLDFKYYTIAGLELEYELIFIKNKLNDRWWLKILSEPELGVEKSKYYLFPCSYKDYEMALRGDLSERCWQALKKIV